VIRFYFVTSRGEADTIERILFDVFVGWDVVPTREFVLFLCRVIVSGWNPIAAEDSLFVSVDVTSAGDCSLWCVLEVALCLELLLPFFFIEGFVTEGSSDFLGDWMKHEMNSVIIIEVIARMTIIMSSVN
jgi:hypothetical protein